jgi:type I restriction enzyme, S subunit
MALSRKPAEIVDEGTHTLLVKAPWWERVFVSEIATVQNGYPFESEAFTHGEGMPLIRIRDITETSTENFYKGQFPEEFIVKKGDLLIGMDGDFTAARWRGPAGLLNQRVCRLTQTTHLYLYDFLFLCLQPYLNAINAETSSITVKHLSSRTVGEIPLPLPPTAEQRRIVAKIEELFSELDRGIENLKQARAQLTVYRQALLKHAFEGKLTESWRKAHADKLDPAEQILKRIREDRETQYLDQLAKWKAAESSAAGSAREPAKPAPWADFPPEERDKLPRLPHGWTWTKFSNLYSSLRNGVSVKPAGDRGQKILRISAVRPMSIDIDDYRFLGANEDEYAEYLLEQGDLLFTRYNGTLRFVGVCACFKGNERRIYPDKLIRARIKNPSILPGFLEAALNCGVSRTFIESRVKTTAGQAGIAGNDLKPTPVPICSPREQKEILSILDTNLSVLAGLAFDIDTNLQKAEVLRQAVLMKAFSGELVSQDPNDEPASALLARIKAERERSDEQPANVGGTTPACRAAQRTIPVDQNQ